MSELSAIIERLSNMHSWNIHEVKNEGMPTAWYEVVGMSIIPDLVIKEEGLQEQAQAISAQIAHWGRLVAQCKRVVDVVEREYRIWRDTLKMQLIESAEKKMTDKSLDAAVRAHADYRIWYVRMESVEEAYNATQAVLEGFKAKKDMMRRIIYRREEDGVATLSL